MVEADIANGRFSKLIKTPEQVKDFKEVLLSKYFKYLKGAFMYYTTEKTKEYPGLTMLEFGYLCREGKILDGKLKHSDADRAFIAANFDTSEAADNPENRLCRFEFIEAMTRLAMTRYGDLINNKIPPHEVFTKFMEENVKYNLTTLQEEIETFRYTQVYTLGVHDVIEANLEILDALYKAYRDRNFLFTLESAKNLIRDAKVQIPPRHVLKMFTSSKMSIINEIEKNHKNRNSYMSMQLVEFYEFIARLADYGFIGTENECIPLHLKVDAAMETFASLVEMTKAEFSDHADYYDESEY
eukprot:TRINITY_DN4812_c0_g4_i1.p1 TRINITY_DN4812_c0_g4~~TRINITY_DN4812_c0_g4_i1.p1  ORF type:complete len:299 (-),score=83.70 TRINITY_DN4812_c0_g4_i1:130-1026(-)